MSIKKKAIVEFRPDAKGTYSYLEWEEGDTVHIWSHAPGGVRIPLDELRFALDALEIAEKEVA